MKEKRLLRSEASCIPSLRQIMEEVNGNRRVTSSALCPISVMRFRDLHGGTFSQTVRLIGL
eukprot:862576-Pelagomonas_calceolata.AAC.1